jgi:hypothetical protein
MKSQSLMCVTSAEPNGHSVLNGDVIYAQNGVAEGFERVQIVNDEKQFTFVALYLVEYVACTINTLPT